MNRSGENIVVIGRGIAGLSSALELLRGGRPVTVIAPEIDDHMGTRAAVGLSSIKGSIQALKPQFALKKMGYEGLRAWLASIERDSSERIPQIWTGSSEVFFNLTEYEGIRNRVFHRKFTGAHRVQCLGREGLQKIGGGLGVSCGEAIGGFHFSSDGWFDPRKAMSALEFAIRSLGGKFIDAAVNSVVEGPNSDLIVSSDKGDVTGSEVILAAGYASNKILDNSVQYEVAKALKQAPFAGETLFGSTPTQEPDYLVQYKKTTLVMASGAVTYGSGCYLWPSEDGARSAAREQALNALRDKHFKLGWQKSILTRSIFGIRGRGSDRLPLFGPLLLPSRNRRIWIVSGLYKNGLTLSHLFARELRRIFCESNGSHSVSEPFEPFDPRRLT